MKKNVHLIIFTLLLLVGFSAVSRQKIPSTRTYPKSLKNLDLSDLPDTPLVTLLREAPAFPTFNFVYKNRLDSLQNAVPLTYNEHVQKYIEVFTARKDMMGKMLGLSNYYFPIFEKALQSYNIPLEIKYIPVIESSMNPYAVSRVGATGLWQFMFTTARGYGLKIDSYIDERRDPIEASYAAAAYFSDAYAELGDWLLAIAAYNCGTGNVNRAIAKSGSRDFWEIRPYLPLETRNYVPAFIAAVYVMNCPGKHQIKSQNAGFAKKIDTIQVNRHISLPELAKAMNVEEETLCLLNPSYKRKIVNGTEENPRRIIMPQIDLANYAMVYNVLNSTPVLETKIVAVSNQPVVKYHKVTAGQNLSVIADKYGVEVQDLKVWNRLKGNNIVPGQRLIVSKSLKIEESKLANKYKSKLSVAEAGNSEKI